MIHLTLVLFTLTAPALTQETPRESPLGQVAEALRAGILAGPEDELDSFLERLSPKLREKFSGPELSNLFGSLRRFVPDPEIREIGGSNDLEGRIDLHSSLNNTTLHAHVTVEEDAPHDIRELEFTCTEPLAEPEVESGLSDEEIVVRLDKLLEREAREDRFWGTVLLAKDGETIFSKAHGYASKRYDVANRVDTKFNLASVGKLFTAVSILQLAERGKLSLGDRIIEHLPDYPNPSIAKEVQIDHLLTHTSGMGSFWVKLGKRNAAALLDPADYLPLFADDPLAAPAGEAFRYSNAGYVVLGLIIEAVSGKSYESYIDENVFVPAGMKDTGLYAMDRPVPNLAMGYMGIAWYEDKSPEAGGPYRNNLLLHGTRGGPAGGAYSTAPDLLRFTQAVADGRLLAPDSWQEMRTARADDGQGRRVALGLFLDESKNTYGHNGGYPGISTAVKVFEDSGHTLVILSNFGSMLVVDLTVTAMIYKQ
jgi:CubicO group peptidase (beta-lactamase class C family)